MAAGNPPHHRMRQLWMFVAVDPLDDSEGVLFWPNTEGVPTPLFATDEIRLEQIRRRVLPQVQRIHPVLIRLVRWSVREDIETIAPGDA